MRLLERLSANIFRIFLRPYLRTFEARSIEVTLKRSLNILDKSAINDLKKYVISRQHFSGAFMDRADNPDLYYTLFGSYLCSALDLNENLHSTTRYVENEIRNKNLEGVHLHCAAILISALNSNRTYARDLQVRIRKGLRVDLSRQNAYSSFMSLLSCYYSGDYISLFRIKKQLEKIISSNDSLPLPVIASLLVLQRSFKKPLAGDIQRLIDLYQDGGGFKATKKATVPDLLSTAVGLYALYFAGYDMRVIKPDCLNFIDSLYEAGGFAANILDPDTDIEYTFYGLLALGSLAD
jgi:hypothetical protein